MHREQSPCAASQFVDRNDRVGIFDERAQAIGRRSWPRRRLVSKDQSVCASTMATPQGRSPTAIVSTTVRLSTSTTVTSFDGPFAV